MTNKSIQQLANELAHELQLHMEMTTKIFGSQVEGETKKILRDTLGLYRTPDEEIKEEEKEVGRRNCAKRINSIYAASSETGGLLD